MLEGSLLLLQDQLAVVHQCFLSGAKGPKATFTGVIPMKGPQVGAGLLEGWKYMVGFSGTKGAVSYLLAGPSDIFSSLGIIPATSSVASSLAPSLSKVD